jgi:hypothetical protein
MKGVCTSLPGHVLTFDPVTQLAQVQPGILRVDINGAEFTIPPIVEVPVYFPAATTASSTRLMMAARATSCSLSAALMGGFRAAEWRQTQ